MIEIKNLTKRYGALTAVDGLSLSIKDGLIYGFLGANGAGKSTTLGMITGCLAPTEGSVSVNGFDILEKPLEAKRQIGYLPEIPPLYPEMTPSEFLKFVARARGVAKSELDSTVETAMRKTGVYDVRDRVIRQLSKGYRQRVGLAQAILGDPPVIILDEPTVGLDPEQVVEIRELIRSLGGAHTVIFSSHILSEVSLLCDRVFIIDHGKLLSEDTPENLESMIDEGEILEITVLSDTKKALDTILSLDCVKSAELDETGESPTLRIYGKRNEVLREPVALALSGAGIAVTQMQSVSRSLEDAYMKLIRAKAEEKEENE